jgi:hypothetical protein
MSTLKPSSVSIPPDFCTPFSAVYTLSEEKLAVEVYDIENINRLKEYSWNFQVSWKKG